MASVFARSLASASRRALCAFAPRVQLLRVPLAVRSASHVRCAVPSLAHRAFSAEHRAPPPAVDSLDENRFLELAEKTLNDVQTWIDGIEEMLDESDISFSQGVLTIDLGDHGTWVLNRQVPNRQIWWSSPISGPRRYEFDAASGKWLNTRDKTELFERLQEEISEATGIFIFQG